MLLDRDEDLPCPIIRADNDCLRLSPEEDATVETDDTDELSLSSLVYPNNPVALVVDLFFLGMGGNILPGISRRSCEH